MRWQDFLVPFSMVLFLIIGLTAWWFEPNLASTIGSNQLQTAELLAQERIAYWTLWIGAFTGAGLVALIWTLSATRSMSQAESRAYLAVGQGELHFHGTYGLLYHLIILNTGQTPATDVQFRGELRSNDDIPEGQEYQQQIVEFTASTGEVPANSEDRIESTLDEWHSVRRIPKYAESGSHARSTGTGIMEGAGSPAKVQIVGTLTYRDVYGGQHKLNVSQWSCYRMGSSVTLLGSGGPKGRRWGA